ncbi:hypothetical protein [Paenibacillus sp. USDA918EY]|uniref:hypothetical protein n=1 Tax=Paenibacillus sp. USDA918EY TaxID=2689575 RepID=UPI001F1FF547|nr:hypothetical protein [Paenibacillus sp. USDA918EY]
MKLFNPIIAQKDGFLDIGQNWIFYGKIVSEEKRIRKSKGSKIGDLVRGGELQYSGDDEHVALKEFHGRMKNTNK